MTATRWVRDPAVVWREITDGVLLLPAGATEPFALTDSGAALWELLETPVSEKSAADRLAVAYRTAPEVVSETVGPLLADLERRRAVRQVP